MKLTVIIKAPKADPVVMKVERTCGVLLAIIGGFIVETRLANGISVLWDDRAKRTGKPYNCVIGDEEYYGTVVIIGRRGVGYCSLRRPRKVASLVAEGRL